MADRIVLQNATYQSLLIGVKRLDGILTLKYKTKGDGK